MYAHATAAYQSHKETLSARDLEKRVFMQITAKIEQAKNDTNPLQIDLNKALCDNLLLWNALSADVAIETNPLPEQLKAQIFYLAQFMRHQTNLFHETKEIEKVQAITDINKMMIDGLSTSQSDIITQKELTEQNIVIGA